MTMTPIDASVARGAPDPDPEGSRRLSEQRLEAIRAEFALRDRELNDPWEARRLCEEAYGHYLVAKALDEPTAAQRAAVAAAQRRAPSERFRPTARDRWDNGPYLASDARGAPDFGF